MTRDYKVLEEVVVLALHRDLEWSAAFGISDVDARPLRDQLFYESGVSVVGCSVQRGGPVVILIVEVGAVAHEEVSRGFLAG